MSEAKQAEYDDLFSLVDELSFTHGVDSPEYQQAFARLQELEKELGIVNDPGEE